MGAPELVRELVCGGRRGAAVAVSWNWSASMVLRSETRWSGDGFRQNASVAPQRGTCADSSFSGKIGLRDLIFPGSPGHPARPQGGSSCFWGFVSPRISARIAAPCAWQRELACLMASTTRPAAERGKTKCPSLTETSCPSASISTGTGPVPGRGKSPCVTLTALVGDGVDAEISAYLPDQSGPTRHFTDLMAGIRAQRRR